MIPLIRKCASSWLFFIAGLFLFLSCLSKESPGATVGHSPAEQGGVTTTSLVVLGTIQDAGWPQIGCQKECCAGLHEATRKGGRVVSLGLIDLPNDKSYLFEATPDIGAQLELLARMNPGSGWKSPDGIFLTHAHIGHYTGLMYLGKEAMDARGVPVYAMPRMKAYLSQNGPWNQLVERDNIALLGLEDGQVVGLSASLSVTPIRVPHRDEFSETVGYRIRGPRKSALFIPDIDKWEKWELDVSAEIQAVDYAFLDATFYSGSELGNRDMSEIPHPFILESRERFLGLDRTQRGKVVFIHFNHTNPVLDPQSEASRMLQQEGFRIARPGQVYEL